MEYNEYKYKDEPVITRTIKAPWGINQHACFCCNKPVVTGQSGTLIISNHKYFGNVVMHSECFKKRENEIDKLFSDMENAYVNYKQLSKIFGQSN